MKRFLTLILLTTSVSTFGQNYFPLIRPNLVWQILHGDGSQICNLSGGNRYFFQGDTTILGFQYKIIHANSIVQINAGPYCPPFAVDGSSSWVTGSFIREDTSAKKIFVYDQGNNSDALLYDFNLIAGDTLNSNYAGQGFTLIVDSVRTITLLNGAVRKIFYLNDNEYYIESVGGSQGLQFPIIQAIGFWEVPTCMSENYIQLWGTQCFGFVGIDELKNNNSINVYPNPFDDKITISTDNIEQSQIILYDILSRKHLQGTFTNSTTINTQQLADGIYMYEVQNKNRTSTKGKLIKQK